MNLILSKPSAAVNYVKCINYQVLPGMQQQQHQSTIVNQATLISLTRHIGPWTVQFQLKHRRMKNK